MAIIRRGVIKKSPITAYRVVVVVGDDSTNTVETVDVSIPIVEGQAVPEPSIITLPLRKVKPNGNKRYVYTNLIFADGDPVGQTYELISVMKDINNAQVGEPLTTTTVVKSDGDPRLRSIFIKQVNTTKFQLKVVIVGDDLDEIKSIDIVFDDILNSGLPTPVPTTIHISSPSSVNGGKKVFKDTSLSFTGEGGIQAALDQVYTLDVIFKNNEGVELSSTEEDVIIEGLDVN